MNNAFGILARIFRGSAQPRLLGLAAGLGLTAGLVAGWNFTFLAFLLAALALNLSAGRFIAALAIGMLAAWLAEPLFAAVGYLLLDRAMLGSILALAADSPIVAMFDLDRYSVAGGLAIGGPVSFGLGRLIASRRIARVSSAHPALASPIAPVLRPMGAPLCIVAIALAAWLPWWLGAKAIERQLLAELSRVHRAEVTAERIDLSLWTGRLVIENLEIPDVENLDQNELQIGRVTARLQSAPLLRGSLQIDDLLLENLRTDVPRGSPAARAANVGAPGNEEDDERPFGRVEEGFALEGCLRQPETLRRQLAWLGKVVAAVERLGIWERANDDLDRPLGLFALAGIPARMHRSDLGNRLPLVYIRQLRAAGLDEGWELGRNSELAATHLSSSPKLTRSAARIDVQAPEFGVQATVDLPGYEDDEIAMPQVSLQATDVPLADLLDVGQSKPGVWILAGKATIDARGVADATGVQVAIDVDATDLRIRCDGESEIAGMSPTIWMQGIDALGGLRLDLALAGTWQTPQLHFDETRLADSFKQQLRGAGAHEIVQAAEREKVEKSTKLFARGRTTDSPKGPRYKYPDEQQAPERESPSAHTAEAVPTDFEEGGFAIAADSPPDAQTTADAPVEKAVAIRYPKTRVPQDEPLLPPEPRQVAATEPIDEDSASESIEPADDVMVSAVPRVDRERVQRSRRDELADNIASDIAENESLSLPEEQIASQTRRNGYVNGHAAIRDGETTTSPTSMLPGPINLVTGYDFDGGAAQTAGPYQGDSSEAELPGIRRIDPLHPAIARPPAPEVDSQAAGIRPIGGARGTIYDLPDDPVPQDRPTGSYRNSPNGTTYSGQGTAVRGTNPNRYGSLPPEQPQQSLVARGNGRSVGAGARGENEFRGGIQPGAATRPAGGQGMIRNPAAPANYPADDMFAEPEPEGNGFTRWTRSMGSKISGIFKKKPRPEDEGQMASQQNVDPFQRQYRR